MEGVLYQGDGTLSCITHTHTRAQSSWSVMREPNRLTYIANRQCRKISQHTRFSQNDEAVTPHIVPVYDSSCFPSELPVHSPGTPYIIMFKFI